MKNIILVTLALFAPISFSQDRVSRYDFDRDGKVSFTDINQYCVVPANLFQRADKDSDSYLNNYEMRTAKGYLFSRCNQQEESEPRTPASLED